MNLGNAGQVSKEAEEGYTADPRWFPCYSEFCSQLMVERETFKALNQNLNSALSLEIDQVLSRHAFGERLMLCQDLTQ